MKSIFAKFTWLKLMIGILIVALGVVFIVTSLCSNASIINGIVCKILGIYLIVMAAAGIILGVSYEINAKQVLESLPFAIILAVGIALCFQESELIIKILVQLLVPWMFVCVGGVYLLQSLAEVFSRFEVKTWLPRLILGAILLTAGIILVFNVDKVVDFLYLFLGVIIVLLGVAVIYTGALFMKANKVSVKKK